MIEFEFEKTAIGSNEHKKAYEESKYIWNWVRNSGLYIRRNSYWPCIRANSKEGGLFNVFVAKTLIDSMRKWSSRKLINREWRDNNIKTDEVNAFPSLRIAMSIMKFNGLKDYWSSKIFMRSLDFKKAMSSNIFQNLRSSIKLYSEYDQELASVDHLEHSRNSAQAFALNAVYVAVRTGESTLNENTTRCKGRTSVQTYMSSKPIKFGFRLYGIAGW